MADDDKPQPRTTEEIRADIEATRDELGDTVEALAAKTDVKARAQERVDEVKADVHEKTEAAQEQAKAATEKAKANPVPVVGVVVALGLIILIRRRRA